MEELKETGPLAADVRIVRLPELVTGPCKIRLRFTKGHWRLDYVALALMNKKVKPLRLQPIEVFHNSNPDQTAKEILLDTSKVLITLPGDVYTLIYSLPDDFTQYELFLKTRGYYMEWIRDEWLLEESPARAAMMILNPDKALRELAPEFKQVEPDLEDLFWSSRYAR